MNVIELEHALRQLRLGGMAAAVEMRLRQAQAEPMAPIDLTSCMVTDELTRRSDRLLERSHKQAEFRDTPQRTLDKFDFGFNPKMNRSSIFDLATGAFIGKREDGLFLGPGGTGKSHLAQAIGHAAILAGLSGAVPRNPCASNLALRAPAEIVQAVLSTALATDLSNSEFWRTVWIFLIANASIMDTARIAPLIDFIQAIRHACVTMATPAGMVELGPPQPEFSMKGRPVQSMLRLMQDRHRSLGVGSADLAWTPSPLIPMLFEEPCQDPSALPKRWQMMELTNIEQLRIEGAALHHCVASYADRCCRGMSRIWSLRSWRGDKVRHVLTIEIDPKRRAVVQARGCANRFPSGRPLQLLQDWAGRERLKMAI